jgi:diguanylate cyclase (GGDEF)-like protein
MARITNSGDLKERITSLLADEANQGHPLHPPLEELWKKYSAVIERLNRISHVSDAYQASARERELNQSEQLERQLRQLEKISRISDRYQRVMHDLNLALKQAATHDSMTGLANRRLLLERLKSEAERSARNQRPFCVAMLDVDHFKQINDTYGHDVGDQVLTEVARVLKSTVREYDLCGRWGGEEFLILLPEVKSEAALQSIRRVCDGISALRIRNGAELLCVNVSGGIAEFEPLENYSETINRADHALYVAKRNGRNRLELAEPRPRQITTT